MRKPIFRGVCTALVTPFLNGNVNYPMAEMLISRQMENGVNAVVLAGTTGDSPTLSDQEKLELFRKCKDFTGNKCTIIAGTGSNDTSHAVSLSKEAESVGADALLVVSPYYNKATPTGLISHYTTIADAVNIPVILYNVPSRTGVDIPISVYRELSSIPNIIGVKEASPDITKITKIRNACPEDFYIWSGNDDQTVPAIALGAQGVISVVSNVLPAQTQRMAMSALDEKMAIASALQLDLQPFVELMFSEVNPIPVKAAMKCIGFDCGGCRLPLTDPSSDCIAKIKTYFQ